MAGTSKQVQGQGLLAVKHSAGHCGAWQSFSWEQMWPLSIGIDGQHPQLINIKIKRGNRGLVFLFAKAERKFLAICESSFWLKRAYKWSREIWEHLPINTTGRSKMGQGSPTENDLSSGHNPSQKHTLKWSHSVCYSRWGDGVSLEIPTRARHHVIRLPEHFNNSPLKDLAAACSVVACETSSGWWRFDGAPVVV